MLTLGHQVKGNIAVLIASPDGAGFDRLDLKGHNAVELRSCDLEGFKGEHYRRKRFQETREYQGARSALIQPMPRADYGVFPGVSTVG